MVTTIDRIARRRARNSGAVLSRSAHGISVALLLACSSLADPAPARAQARPPTLAELAETADLSALAP